MPDKPDMVNQPPHYIKGKIETIDFILDQDFPYLAGQVVKYISRYRHKGSPVEDLKKAEWYLKKLIGQMESIDQYTPSDVCGCGGWLHDPDCPDLKEETKLVQD